MKFHLLLLCAALCISTNSFAQTKIIFSDVHAIDGRDSLQGKGATIVLNKAEGSDKTVIMVSGDVIAEVHAKVTTHKSPRSSLKDSAVNLTMEIDLHAGKEKDNRRIEKIFYLDQSRSGTVTERFNFKHGLDMRIITLSFTVSIE